MEKNNFIKVLFELIRTLGISVTRQSLHNESDMHPNKNSLLAMSDILNSFHIPNASYLVDINRIHDVPTPFIAHFSSNQREFVLVSSINENNAIVSNEHWRRHKLCIEDFKKSFDGNILIAQKEQYSGELDYLQNKRHAFVNELRTAFAIFGLAIIFIDLLITNSKFGLIDLPISLLILLKTIGLIISMLLLVQTIDSNNSLVHKFCNQNKGCMDILNSPASKILGQISWGEVGFFYFSGTLLVMIFNSNSEHLMNVLSIINICSLPFTFYSIYYQFYFVKKWCKICVFVQALLWIEFCVFNFYTKSFVQKPNLSEWNNLLLGMLTPILLWMLFKPYLLAIKKNKTTKFQLQRFKNNAKLFQQLLSEEIKHILPDDDYSIILGNKDSETVITMVSNPYCQPCAKAHKVLDKWLISRPDIKIQIIFSTRNSEHDSRTDIAKHFLSLKCLSDDNSIKQALNTWYEQKKMSYSSWAKKYPININPKSSEFLDKQNEWCRRANIEGTPAIFINGQKIPYQYEPQDIKYLI